MNDTQNLSFVLSSWLPELITNKPVANAFLNVLKNRIMFTNYQRNNALNKLVSVLSVEDQEIYHQNVEAFNKHAQRNKDLIEELNVILENSVLSVADQLAEPSSKLNAWLAKTATVYTPGQALHFRLVVATLRMALGIED